jgi:2-succinyl-6-hydroxy-2,4-cyclohexadiene-1-carboxylate synthase
VVEDLVLLHGFAGTHRAWDRVLACLPAERYRPLVPDLPGHGERSEAGAPISFAGCVAEILELAPPRFTLCGYSLGGRVALRVALAAPQRVARLLLIACSPGLLDPEERAARREADGRIAAELERGTLEGFIERWNSQPLFAEDPPEVVRLAQEDQRRNHPRPLAAALRGLGAGEMPPLWARLGELEMPVTVIAGSRDRKFRRLAEQTVRQLAQGSLLVLPGGHRLALESPREVAGALLRHPW